MTDDWLFDGTGSPDPDAAQLSTALSTLAHDVPKRPTRVARVLAAAAVVTMGAGVAWWVSTPAPWSTETLACSGCVWVPGEPLDTRSDATARLEARGELVAASGSELRRLAGPGARLELTSGRIDVRVNAEAGWLTVQLPGVELVDLGCAFAVQVDDTGHGVVQVGSGAVALRGDGPTTTLPAGTLAATWPDGHTGLAVRTSAPAGFVAAVDAYDRGGDWQPVLRDARIDDAVTVWHLLDRADRPTVVARLEQLLGAEAVDAEGLLSDDPQAEEDALAYIVGRTL